MGTYVCFDRHIHIGYETRTNGILSQLGYVDINEQMLNEIVNNKRLKCIQISECLPDEAYRFFVFMEDELGKVGTSLEFK